MLVCRKVVSYIFPAKALFEGLILDGAYLRREICVSKSIRLAYRKFTVFYLFYFVFEDFVFKYKPLGAYMRRGHLTKGFLRYGFDHEGLIFGGAYTWRGLFSEFYGIERTKDRCMAIYN